MKKLLSGLTIIFLLTGICYAKNRELNVKSKNFEDFGRYLQTLETNEAPKDTVTNDKNEKSKDNGEKTTTSETDDDLQIAFELEAIKEAEKRLERNSVELNLSEPDFKAMEAINSSRLFKIRVNEEQFITETKIKNENMIWDDSKTFLQSVIRANEHFAPIPSVVNSSKIIAKTGNLSVALGQVSLHDSVGSSVLFMRSNESMYNTGSVLTYKGDMFNVATGTFLSSYNYASSGGIIVSTKDAFLPFKIGSFSLGGALGAKEDNGFDKTSGGIFGEYKYKRLSFNAQIATAKFSNADNVYTSFYFVPEFKVTDSLSLKTRFIKNVTENTMQDELVLSYAPKKNNNNLLIELNASNFYTDTANLRQRLKLSTSFRI